MKTVPLNPSTVSKLREEASLCGIRINSHDAWTLLKKVGDPGLVVDALLLDPRPAWLVAIVGAKKK